jgi:hypothetical protein
MSLLDYILLLQVLILPHSFIHVHNHLLIGPIVVC